MIRWMIEDLIAIAALAAFEIMLLVWGMYLGGGL